MSRAIAACYGCKVVVDLQKQQRNNVCLLQQLHLTYFMLPKQALKQSTGAQRQQYESWRRTLLQCLANIEAVIDFGEDEEIAEEVAEQVLPRVRGLRQQLEHHLVNGKASPSSHTQSL